MIARTRPRRLRHLLLLSITAVAFGTFFSAGAITAHADDTDGIGASPSSGSGPDSRTRFSYQVSPGQQVTDFFFVKNSGTVGQTVHLYATDAYTADDDELSLLASDVPPTDVGTWVRFADGSKQLDLPMEAGTSQVVPFTVTVPADAAPGDHVGGMIVSSRSPSGQVIVDTRVASRLYLRVKGDIQANLTVSNISADYAPQFNPLDGTATINVTLTNSGNVALGGKAVFGVRALFGIGVAQTEVQNIPEILPGSTRSVSVQVPQVGQWGYLNPYVELVPTVDKEAIDPGPLATVTRDTVIFAVPWVVLVVLGVAVVFWLFLRIRNARDEKSAQRWIDYTEAEARRKALEGTGANDSAASEAPDGSTVPANP